MLPDLQSQGQNTTRIATEYQQNLAEVKLISEYVGKCHSCML